MTDARRRYSQPVNKGETKAYAGKAEAASNQIKTRTRRAWIAALADAALREGGLTLSEVARRAGLTPKRVSNIVNCNHSSRPGLKSLRVLIEDQRTVARVLGCEWAALFCHATGRKGRKK